MVALGSRLNIDRIVEEESIVEFYPSSFSFDLLIKRERLSVFAVEITVNRSYKAPARPVLNKRLLRELRATDSEWATFD